MKKILFYCLFLFSFLTSQNVTSAVEATSNPLIDGDVLNRANAHLGLHPDTGF
mgnify:CR=1